MREVKATARLKLERRINQIKLDKSEKTRFKEELKLEEKTAYKSGYKKEKLKIARKKGKAKANRSINSKGGKFLSKTESLNEKHKTKDVWNKQGRNVFK